MNKFSKVLVGISTTAILTTAAFASCGKDQKSCDMKKDGEKYCKMHKGDKHHSMCSMKKSQMHGENSPKMIMKAIEKLDLTKEQREEIAAIKNKYHATMPKLSDAFSKNSLDEKKLNEALNFDVKTIQFKIITESYGVLNDIQKGFLKERLDKKTNHKKSGYHKYDHKKHCEMSN